MSCQISELLKHIKKLPKLNQQIVSFLQHKQEFCEGVNLLNQLKINTKNRSQEKPLILCKMCQKELNLLIKCFPQSQWSQMLKFTARSLNSSNNAFIIQIIDSFFTHTKTEIEKIEDNCPFGKTFPTTIEPSHTEKHKTCKPLQSINKKDQQQDQGSGQNIIKNSLNLEEMKQNSTMEFIDLGKNIPPKNQDMIEQELKLGTQSNSDDKKKKPTKKTEIKEKEEEIISEANNNKCCKYCCCLLI